MALRACSFETARLLVKSWHSFSSSDWRSQELADVVTGLMTQRVTRSLPSAWQGTYTKERAGNWIQERDREGPTLLVVDKLAQEAVGLIILFETRTNRGVYDTEVRLGYLLSEDSWGKGMASELVDGFVCWCREQTPIPSIASGVAINNPASRRVLQTNGFELSQGKDEDAQDEQIYRLSLI